ncbi:FISUMP domain-containing protein [Fibrobacter sp. UWEL]|uniref:FISUMP domain-containing protein n=1 Tax=Fibrobacter sp. UWEL TaxID=1896209 RepID=UPI0009F8D46B|nr:FISUMP domain-containing protein [Fibrobacter sp. UWEL]
MVRKMKNCFANLTMMALASFFFAACGDDNASPTEIPSSTIFSSTSAEKMYCDGLGACYESPQKLCSNTYGEDCLASCDVAWNMFYNVCKQICFVQNGNVGLHSFCKDMCQNDQFLGWCQISKLSSSSRYNESSSSAYMDNNCYTQAVSKCNGSHIGATGVACNSSVCCRTSAEEYCDNPSKYPSSSSKIIVIRSSSSSLASSSSKAELKFQISYGSFEDARDHQIYKTVSYETNIWGTQTWMAQNLNYDWSTVNKAPLNSGNACANPEARCYHVSDNYCYDRDEENCLIFGQLYKSSILTKICPEGWRIPNKEDYKILFAIAKGNAEIDTIIPAEQLKSTHDWKSYMKGNTYIGDWGVPYFDTVYGTDRNGTDAIGFNILPAGNMDMYKKINPKGAYDEYKDVYEGIYGRTGFFFNDGCFSINPPNTSWTCFAGNSVRCIKD